VNVTARRRRLTARTGWNRSVARFRAPVVAPVLSEVLEQVWRSARPGGEVPPGRHQRLEIRELQPSLPGRVTEVDRHCLGPRCQTGQFVCEYPASPVASRIDQVHAGRRAGRRAGWSGGSKTGVAECVGVEGSKHAHQRCDAAAGGDQ
jgi:hypothetical protein